MSPPVKKPEMLFYRCPKKRSRSSLIKLCVRYSKNQYLVGTTKNEIMIIRNLFDQKETQETIDRINNLSAETQRQWGKMDVAQMMAHCNVAYEVIYTDKHPKPKGFGKLMANLFAKKIVIGPKPYKRNNPTAPIFKIKTEKDFEVEKKRLIEYLKKTQQLGGGHFEGKENPAFGKLTEKEWNTLFSKHLDHHLQQFGV